MNEQAQEVSAGAGGLAGRNRHRTGIDPLLRWRFFPRLFHWVFFAVTIILIYFAFAPGQRGEGNLATDQSLKDCFYDRKTGGFDEHAAGCTTCLDEAMDIGQWRDEGFSPTEIRNRIDEKYTERGDPTDTPMP